MIELPPAVLQEPKAQEYIESLRDASETNHTHGKYQFAFLHMLALVNANREPIARFEQKIQTTRVRVWGDGKSAASAA